jgi:outer membrane protein OmpA-like peptidoglycan-associated protein
MNLLKTVLYAGAAVALLAPAAASAAPKTPAITLAQAQTEASDAVAIAKAKVEAARKALREAATSGQGVAEAKQALDSAMKELAQAEAAQTAAPPTANATPSADQQPPADAAAPAAIEPPPANAAETPPVPKKRPANTAVQPPAGQDQPAAAGTAPATANPPAPLANGQPGPQIPAFDPSMLKRQHPKFGETPPADAKVNLPKDEAAIPKGGEINAGAGRTIVKEADGQVTIRHDDASRFVRPGGKVNEQKGPNGTITTTVNRPDGAQVVTIKDASGNILQRYRKNRDGSVEVLIGAVEPQRGARTPPPAPKPQGLSVTFDFGSRLPPLRLTIPRNDYIVESSRASRRQLEQTFAAPPVEQVERPYTLEEIRRSDRIRNKVRRVDFDTVTFEFGSAVLPDDQIPQTQKIGEAMRAVLDKDPNQVFLIEGYTDAVGSDLANLALSDRRAETVAEILTYYFKIPPENLITQGYGEQFLKIATSGPERQNRRVAFRNITLLMRVGSQ